jgi:hypothetical protein
LKRILTLAATTLLASALNASPAWAHGGEEHSHPEDAATASVAATTPQGPRTPRASAQSEEFELVATLAEKTLTVYLDDYASNAPVADAQIELESGAVKQVAQQTEPGVYLLPGEAFAKPGKYPLVFSIETADSADLLTATLTVTLPAAETAQPVAQATDRRLVWGAAGASLLAAIGVVLFRRRK